MLFLVNRKKTKEETLTLVDIPRLDTILVLLSFLDNIPQIWSHQSFPSQDCIQGCRTSLQRLVRAFDLDRKQPQDISGADRFGSNNSHSNSKLKPLLADTHEELTTLKNNLESSSQDGLLLPASNNNKENSGKSLLATLLRISSDAKERIERFQDKKGVVVFVILMVMLAWRKRHRMTSVSVAALHLFLAPIREVVDAVLKPS